MKKRLMAVAAVGLLIAGAWLGNIFRGFGLGGSGTGEGTANAPAGDTHVSLTAGSDSTPSVAASPKGEAATAEGAPVAEEVVTVLIDEDKYQLQSGDDVTARFEPATLEALVELAKARKGDAHGIRVRLRFKRNAHSGATSDLYSALQAAGIPREQIVEATGYVE